MQGDPGALRLTRPKIQTMVTQHGLTPRQAMFAKAYVANGNGAEAARNAGYSERTAKQQGSRLLTNVDVQAEIAALEAAQREDDAVDRAYVLHKLRFIAESGEKESNRLRAAELLGKSVGLFVELVDVRTTHDVEALQQYTPDQLRIMLAEARRQSAVEVEATMLTDAEETD